MNNKSNTLAKLSPTIDYKPLIRLIGEAHGALGELNGLLLKNVLNPELLMSPLLTKEAVFSSRIEGTQATLEDVFHYEARAAAKIAGQDKDIKEIINYRRVLNFSLGDLKDSPINQEFIKKVHYYLLDSVRGSDKDRGKFRQGRVFIGPPGISIEEASYVPPEPAFLPGLMNNWEWDEPRTLTKGGEFQAEESTDAFTSVCALADGDTDCTAYLRTPIAFVRVRITFEGFAVYIAPPTSKR